MRSLRPVPARLALALSLAVPALAPAALLAQRPAPAGTRDTGRTPADTLAATLADTLRRAAAPDSAADPLDVDLTARIESKAERVRNERCASAQLYNPYAACRGTLQPAIGFQFNLKSSGVVADRVRVDVDYDSQREFDASNNLSLTYEGKGGEFLRRIELGNVNFAPPQSRFLTGGIASGNLGVQAIGGRGAFQVAAIAAQQRGNVVRDQQFTIGERAQRSAEREVEDYQVEARRFFFTVDPRQLPGYPNVDIIDRGQMMRAAASLPDTVRPSRLFVYRLQYGTQPQDPSGPRFRLLSDPARGRQVYDVLREGVDYYADPSLLWIALVRPLNQANERLVVAYRVRINGRDTTWTSTGGTPDLAGRAEDQWANLVWDPSVAPNTPAFAREIRSAYRVGGGEILRGTVRLRVAAGSGDQEKPRAGSDATYLQMLGMAQAQNPADFDVDNRLWPRPSDPNFNLGAPTGPGGQRQKILNDQYVVFPSLRPFAARDSGLIVPGNPVNDAIYRTPGEYLYYGSAQRPASVYRLRLRYETGAGSDAVGSLTLGAVQLRRGSDRLVMDGRLLVRDLDYTIDYELGEVTFTRPDTLFRRPRTVSVRYEENPLFAATPTTIFGLTSQYTLRGGAIAFTAISQRQQTSFTRPQLGLEAAGSTMMGVSGNYRWYLGSLPGGSGSHPERSEGSGPGARAPGGSPAAGAGSFAPLRMTAGQLGMTSAPYLDLTGELALSRPQSGNATTAYVESFEGEGGLAIGLADFNWQYSSLPFTGRAVASRFGPGLFDTRRAATLAWQTNAADPNGRVLTRRITDIDPAISLTGGISAPEQLLWLSLYPLHIGGQYDRASRDFRWTTPATAAGARFRSIQTVLAPAGRDLSRVEQVEFWALVDTSAAGRARNGTLVLDVGDISENAIAFVPETLSVARGTGAADSLYTGKALAGYDSLDTERDPFSRAFNAAVNDIGLPGDRVPSLVVLDGAQRTVAREVPLCRGLLRSAQVLGDTRTDCTVRNAQLDEEDIDLDGAMNFTRPEGERILRWVIDLGDPERWVRVGLPDTVRAVDASGAAVTEGRRWVLIRAPFRAPDDSVGSPDILRMRALRLTLVSGAAQRDDEFTRLAIARLRLVGAPWVRRAEGAVAGVGGTRPGPGAGRVITSVIGTNDRDENGGLLYESPPGIIDELDTRAQPIGTVVQQINERSLRLQATDLPLWSRAEAYYRFPAGQQTFMGYRELRIWARGRNSGWGAQGDLQFFVKIGRDENNFYLYRTPVNSGPGREAWNPEVRVDLERFYALREQLQAAYLRNDDGFPGCTAADSALIVQSGLPASGIGTRRWAACDGGYLVYSLEPNVTPPNLAAAQEMAVGMLRVGGGANGIGAGGVVPGDTLELWVDDIRLTHVVNRMGAAGEVAMNLVAPGLGDVRVSWSRRDPWFRQLNEQSTFADQGVLDVTSTLRLDRMLPVRGYALPLTISHSGTASTPEFLSGTDLRGSGVPGLRRPSSGVTTYNLVARRTEPSHAGVLAPLVDNLGVHATYTTGAARTEYQDGGSHALTVGLDYDLAAAPRELPLPAWAGTLARVLGGWTMRGGVPDSVQPRLNDPQRDTVAGRDSGRVRPAHAIRWSPTQLRVTSALVRGDERRNTFFLPA
ncbi:MAG TPA: cell surface protein SprA, partial [Gemmatimonadaceae bacterium]